MAKTPAIPPVQSELPKDMRRFVDRVREVLNNLNLSAGSSLGKEATPSVLAGMVRVQSAAAATNYTIGHVRPHDDDLRVRVVVVAGATGDTFTVTHGSNTYSFTLGANEAGEVTVNGARGIKEPYYVKAVTAGVDFSAFLFLPSRFNASL